MCGIVPSGSITFAVLPGSWRTCPLVSGRGHWAAPGKRSPLLPSLHAAVTLSGQEESYVAENPNNFKTGVLRSYRSSWDWYGVSMITGDPGSFCSTILRTWRLVSKPPHGSYGSWSFSHHTQIPERKNKREDKYKRVYLTANLSAFMELSWQPYVMVSTYINHIDHLFFQERQGNIAL